MRSNWMKPFWLLTLTAAVLLTSAAFADTVVLTPDSLAANGWAMATYYGAQATIKDVSIQIPYPFSKDTSVPPVITYKYASPAGGPLPYGAFYGNCGVEGSDPPASPDSGQVWVGTNQLTGKYLSQITKLEYDTWTLSQGTDLVHYVWQPFQIQIAIRKTGPTDPNWRYLMFRPWGTAEWPAGFNGLNPYNTWVGNHHNAMSGIWFEPWSHKTFIGWDAVKAAYPSGYIDTPLNDPRLFPGTQPGEAAKPGTGTGYSFNLEAGARGTSPFLEPTGAWWQESYNFVGCVDNVTIGVDGVDTTYDFEPTNRPDPSAIRTVMTNNASVKARVNRLAKYNTRYVVAGYVQGPIDMEHNNDYVVNQTFKIGDRNDVANPGNVVFVVCTGHTFMPGEFVRVEGLLDEITTPAMITTTPDKVTVIYP